MRVLTSALFISAIFLAACAPEVPLRYDATAAGVGKTERVFFSTTRKNTEGQPPDPSKGDRYSYERDFSPRYGRFDISIPPNREVGSLPLPKANKPVDPTSELVAISSSEYSRKQFRQEISREFARTKRGKREAVVFVHGYNNNFASALYRFAQISHDLKIDGVSVQYSWPSRGSVLGYAYDRDSVLFARDGLEQLLEEIVAAGADSLILVGHSMGSQLAMETLRQISHKNNQRLWGRLSGVVLMSPDIDVSVFRTQAAGLRKLPQPIMVLASSRDKALSVASLLSRDDKGRLGSVTDIKELEGANVTLIDTGTYSSGDGHFDAATSPALIRLLTSAGDIDSALSGDARARIGLLPGAVLTARGATQIVLSPVLRSGESLLD